MRSPGSKVDPSRSRTSGWRRLAMAAAVLAVFAPGCGGPDAGASRLSRMAIVDGAGRVRIELGVSPDGVASLTFLSQSGEPQLVLEAAATGGSAAVRVIGESKDVNRVWLGASGSLAGFIINSPDGEARIDATAREGGVSTIGIRDGVENPRFHVTRWANGAVSSGLFGTVGRTAIIAECDETGAGVEVRQSGEGDTVRMPAK